MIADSRQQTVDSRQRAAGRQRQTADSRQTEAGCRQQTVGSRKTEAGRRQAEADSRGQLSCTIAVRQQMYIYLHIYIDCNEWGGVSEWRAAEQ
jgi:hypothetical protein